MSNPPPGQSASKTASADSGKTGTSGSAEIAGKAAGAAAAEQAAPETTIYTLANGLKVVIREDHFAPVVAQQVWVNAGGADEEEIEAGVAHVHEHMLFKGTERRGVGEIASAVESAGGRINAWTSWDNTVYHIVLASRFAGEGLDILADAVRNSSFDPTELGKELAVVLEEWKRGQDSPDNQLFQTLFATAYTEHPYGRPVIGTEASIKGLTREKVLSFYHRYYTPENMTLIVVGDVDTEAVKAQVEKLFGDFKARPTHRPQRAVEPVQSGVRFEPLAMDVKEARLALGFHIPGADADDVPALDMLSNVLGSGESSRLYQGLVATQIATSAGCSAYTPPDPGLFMFTASLEAPDESKVLDAMIKEIARVRDYPVSLAELERARTNLASDFVYRRETVQGQARELGYFVVVNKDPDYDKTYVKQLNAVTVADIQRVARKYLTKDGLTAVSLMPLDDPSKLSVETVRAAAAPLADSAPIETAKPGEGAAGVAAAGTANAHEAAAGGEPHLFALPNGARIIIQEHHEVPLFSVRAAVLGGLLAETPANNGISNFVADMLTRGTAKRTHEELAVAIESLAGQVSGFSGRNSLGVSGGFLSEHFAEGMDLILEVLLQPRFRDEDVEKARRELLLAIKNREDDSAHRAFDLIWETVYPDHPYGMTTLGTADSVGSLSTEDLTRFYADMIDPSNLVISVVGDVDEQVVLDELTRALSGLRDDAARFAMPPAAAKPTGLRRATLHSDRKQTHIVVAFPGVSLKDGDRHALSVLETVLSRQGGRLFYELRDKQALAYSVAAFDSEGLAPGIFGAYIGTDPDNETKATAGLLAELDKVRRVPISADELERAQRYLIGSHDIGMQTNGAIADTMTFNEMYGLGYLEDRNYADEIRKVTVEDVQRVAKKYLDPAIHAEVVVGPEVQDSTAK